MRVIEQRLLPALVGNGQREGQGDVVERVGGGAGNAARHVGDTVMDDAVDHVGRLRMGGGLGRFGTAALVDCDVDQHRTRLPVLQHRLGHQLRGRSARDQHAADHEVGRGAFLFHRTLGGIDRLDAGAEAGDQLFHAIGVLLEDGHVGAHAERHHGGIGANDATAEDDDLARRHAGNAAQQHAEAALCLFKAMRAGLHRHAARDLAHRRQQRQAAAGRGDGLVGDAHRTGRDEVLGLLGIGCQVEVGVEDLAGAQHLALDGLRLLHLHDHVGLGEDFRRRGDDLGAGRSVVRVRCADARTGIGLHPDLVAVAHGFLHRSGRHAHAVFVILDLFWNADEH